MSGNRMRDISTVSIEVNSRWIPRLSHPLRMNAMSNPALCATRGRPPAKSRNAGSASDSSGASRTVSSEMPVSSVMFGGIGLCGLT